MAVLKDTLRPHLLRVREQLDALKRMRIRVGVQGDEDSDLLMIAGVHEYGMIITAKKAKNLAIPLRPEAKNKSPRDFPGLFFIESKKSGYLFGVTRKGGGKKKENNLNFLFLLLPSVTIPERSFIRASYDTGKEDIGKACETAVRHIIFDEWTAAQAAESIGAQALQMTQDYFNTKLGPSKSELTQSLSTQYQTLYETGRLYHSITYKVEEE